MRRATRPATPPTARRPVAAEAATVGWVATLPTPSMATTPTRKTGAVGAARAVVRPGEAWFELRPGHCGWTGKYWPTELAAVGAGRALGAESGWRWWAA